MELMPRDIAILRQVARFRFLHSGQIARLIGGARQPLLRRLHRLFHHGYLDRPRSQIDYFHRGGSKPLVHGLGRKGVSVLFPDVGQRPRLENLQVGRLHLQHTLHIAEVLITIELACRGRDDVRYVPEEELRSQGGFRWATTVRHAGKAQRVGLVPDGVFALGSSSGDRAYFFLEADRGTMPVQRASLTRSSFFRKLLAYETTWTTGLHAQRFGFHRFRVLTVTESAGRAGHLRETARTLARGQGLFAFTHLAALRDSDPFKLDWLSPTQEGTTRLL